MSSTEGISFHPDADIPSLEGKVILITGASSGLGRQASVELARHRPARIWMTARTRAKGDEAVAHVRGLVPGAAVAFVELDLGSFGSIKRAAAAVLAASPRLDVLMLNAGLMGCPPGLTEEGYEVQMGSNHLGHALLLKLLTPLLHRTADAGDPVRVVSLSSSAWRWLGPEKIRFGTLRGEGEAEDGGGVGGVSPVDRYVQSKCANMLYVRGLAAHRARRGVTYVSVDPGEVDTNLFRREPGDDRMRHLQTEIAPKAVGPIAEGVKNQRWAAVGDGVASGVHYGPVGKRDPSDLMNDAELAEKVWEWTEEQLEGHEL